MAAAQPSKAQTMTVVWNAAAGWNKPVSYIVGWGPSPNNWSGTARTSSTSYQVTGLAPNTLYYVAVITLDSDGLQSPWSAWYHYTTPKQGGPGKLQPAGSTAQ